MTRSWTRDEAASGPTTATLRVKSLSKTFPPFYLFISVFLSYRESQSRSLVVGCHRRKQGSRSPKKSKKKEGGAPYNIKFTKQRWGQMTKQRGNGTWARARISGVLVCAIYIASMVPSSFVQSQSKKAAASTCSPWCACLACDGFTALSPTLHVVMFVWPSRLSCVDGPYHHKRGELNHATEIP